MRTRLSLAGALVAGALPLHAQAPAAAPAASAYRVEDVATPEGLTAEVGGLGFLADGRVVAVFHHGEVMIHDPRSGAWSLFATGLHDPLGVVPISDREMIVAQRPEITRLRDTDGDGRADEFETLSDDFGMSGNYSEFVHGPVMDAEGALYYSLNTASNNGPVREIIRGTYSPRGRIGRMFSAVPYRGWVMKVTPDGRTIPWASGFRSPNGLALDAEGHLWVTDNQGDWLGANKLFQVKQGRFYGHVPSLAWEPGITTIPATIPVPVLDRMRERESVFFPYGILANSPTQPVFDRTDGKFGPFEGQMFVGEMNHHLLMRVMLEEVNGQTQGAVAPFVTAEALKLGSNRLAFAPDGSLWVGHTDHGWLGDKGIQRIVWTGATPMEVKTMSLTPHGFDLGFTLPASARAASDPASYRFTRYTYDYHLDYGSDRMDEQPVAVRSVELSADGLHASVRVDELHPGYVYQLELSGVESRDGTALANATLYYTINQLRPVPPAPAFGAGAAGARHTGPVRGGGGR